MSLTNDTQIRSLPHFGERGGFVADALRAARASPPERRLAVDHTPGSLPRYYSCYLHKLLHLCLNMKCISRIWLESAPVPEESSWDVTGILPFCEIASLSVFLSTAFRDVWGIFWCEIGWKTKNPIADSENFYYSTDFISASRRNSKIIGITQYSFAGEDWMEGECGQSLRLQGL